MKGEVKMENKLRGSYDKVFSAREGLPDEVKRLYEAIAWHLEGADVLSNLDIDCIEMTAYAIYRMRQARQSGSDTLLFFLTTFSFPLFSLKNSYRIPHSLKVVLFTASIKETGITDTGLPHSAI